MYYSLKKDELYKEDKKSSKKKDEKYREDKKSSIKKELRKMTIFFKFISNAGVSLNTQTMAQLSYLTNTTK